MNLGMELFSTKRWVLWVSTSFENRTDIYRACFIADKMGESNSDNNKKRAIFVYLDPCDSIKCPSEGYIIYILLVIEDILHDINESKLFGNGSLMRLFACEILRDLQAYWQLSNCFGRFRILRHPFGFPVSSEISTKVDCCIKWFWWCDLYCGWYLLVLRMLWIHDHNPELPVTFPVVVWCIIQGLLGDTYKWSIVCVYPHLSSNETSLRGVYTPANISFLFVHIFVDYSETSFSTMRSFFWVVDNSLGVISRIIWYIFFQEIFWIQKLLSWVKFCDAGWFICLLFSHHPSLDRSWYFITHVYHCINFVVHFVFVQFAVIFLTTFKNFLISHVLYLPSIPVDGTLSRFPVDKCD